MHSNGNSAAPYILAFVAVSLLAGIATAQEPMNVLETLKTFEAQRASSSDANWRNGNGDARFIAPGKALTIADLAGPGRIVHIWCTAAHADPHYASMLTVRMYWDGEENPSVECPLGDFFGIGFGVDKSFESLPIRVSAEGRARNCYWPMAFRKSARITITNESKLPCNAFYYQVDWQKEEKIADDVAYFHAMYRQEFPCVMGQNYVVADIEGRGHYVGTIQSVYSSSPGWYGEGDDFFLVDGEKEPSIRGTGTEDYFCDAWGFRQQSGMLYGTPLWEGYRAGDRSTAYRFHVPEPVPFRKALRMEMEHKGSQNFPNGETSGFIERDDLFATVAFWYQVEPHKPWPAIATAADRLPFREEVLITGHDVVATATHSQHQIQEQGISGTLDGKQLWFTPYDDKGWVEIGFDVTKERTADLALRMVHSHDYGIYRVRLDGNEVGQLDLYSPDVTPTTDKLGRRTLAAGHHTLRFECVGKSPKSAGYLLGFDGLIAIEPVYRRAPDVDLRTLQKKPN